MTEIYPCATTHPLVDLHCSAPSEMVDGVTGICCAVGIRRIRHINRVSPTRRHISVPHRSASSVGMFLINGLHPFRRAHPERVLPLGQHAVRKGEAASTRPLLPFMLPFGKIKIALRRTVGVNNHLCQRYVSFTRRHYICPCILQHRHKVGHNKTLGQQILHCAEQLWPLPFPTQLALVEIKSMALP